ncbi:MAG: S-methyl-5'-thioadenosine phosphorylase [bacterium]|nr:S-methyl-5'-thioadenosine phosphorylase [bacterium]
MKMVGIIGGSGLNNPDIINDLREVNIATPYGSTTSPLYCGEIGDTTVALIARHGIKHQYSPTEVNYRANIYALKEYGVTNIIATTACGSLKQEIERGHFVILDQFIDFTKQRISSFHTSFSTGVEHTPMAEPFDRNLREILVATAEELNFVCHRKGTVITVEGPRFSSRAESKMFISWGADVINMSIATEVALANEVKVPYAAVAMSTDYDCWKDDEEQVSWDEILKVFNHNVDRVKSLIIRAIQKI